MKSHLPVEMFFRHDLERSGDRLFFRRQMGAEIFMESFGQHFQTELRVRVIHAVQRDPRRLALRSNWILKIILNKPQID